MAESDYYTPPQAARVLGLSRRRVTQMLNEGLLEGEKRDNGRWRIPADSVAAFLKARSKQPRPPSRRPSVEKMVAEIMERSALLEGRVERLTDSLLRLFDRLDRLEGRIDELAKELNRPSR